MTIHYIINANSHCNCKANQYIKIKISEVVIKDIINTIMTERHNNAVWYSPHSGTRGYFEICSKLW